MHPIRRIIAEIIAFLAWLVLGAVWLLTVPPLRALSMTCHAAAVAARAACNWCRDHRN